MAPTGFPYLEPCDSCGQGYAEARDPHGASLCHHCRRRRHMHRSEATEALLDLVREGGEGSDGPAFQELPENSEAVGRHDSRGRVAYLLADGNRFGRFFHELDFNAEDEANRMSLKKLSEAVSDAGAEALLDAGRKLASNVRLDDPGISPVLPLITGGDDIFALLPAPWAFWFVREFTRTFVDAIREHAPSEARDPTISCVLVFCKQKFPYRIAHKIGEDVLEQVKEVVPEHPDRSLLRAVEARSTVAPPALGADGAYGLFALEDEDGGEDGPELVTVEHLFGGRKRLGPMAIRRREELFRLLSNGAETDEIQRWAGRAGETGREPAPSTEGILRVLTDLAPGAPPDSYHCPTPLHGGAGTGNGTVDLLEFWDFLEAPQSKGGNG